MTLSVCRYEYKSQEESEQLVFCIKELKALLGNATDVSIVSCVVYSTHTFAMVSTGLCDVVEAINDLCLFFCGSGAPIKFSTKCASFEVKQMC